MSLFCLVSWFACCVCGVFARCLFVCVCVWFVGWLFGVVGLFACVVACIGIVVGCLFGLFVLFVCFVCLFVCQMSRFMYVCGSLFVCLLD